MSTFVIGDVHGRREQLRRLVEMLPRDPSTDPLVLLGDLIDRCEDVPGTVKDAIALHASATEGGAPVIVLRGNHEQMLLDFIDEGKTIWLHAAVGSHQTFEQYTGRELWAETEQEIEAARHEIAAAVPAHHIEFFRSLPLYHEDEYAIYVHAGVEPDKHPRDSTPHQLLWSRSPEFFKHYHGKPCVFGHTPTPLLPLLGRIGRHGIYISHSAIGIDTGYIETSPLSCLQLPDFMLYQTFADGRTATHHITTFIPEPLRAFR
ncbi:MAG TPA: metallophosphoesterase [Pyrinomonadaceae bacterium]|jgi:serine/threonine protein phosphatase 1|nr:metallophosphoesterase [Pyrinomonadaceae bacterium]